LHGLSGDLAAPIRWSRGGETILYTHAIQQGD
jgi:hypothetical protein